MADHLIRSLLPDVNARVVAVVATDTAREAARRHGAVAGGAVALGRVSASALLLATLTKSGERVTLQVLGDGPLGGVSADANDDGDVRAYLARPAVLVPGGHDRRVSLRDAIGRRGVVSVVRDLGLKESYSGQSPILTGEIDEDVEGYLRKSEQIDSALGCEAVLGAGMELLAVGGVLVQCLPGGDASIIVREAQHRMRTGGLYEVLAAHPDDAKLLARAMLPENLGLDVLDVRPVRFKCRCSAERVSAMLGLLGPAELAAMIEEGKPAEIHCNFCNERYVVTMEELVKVRREQERVPHGET